MEALRIIRETLTEIINLKGEKEDDVIPPSEKGVRIVQDE